MKPPIHSSYWGESTRPLAVCVAALLLGGCIVLPLDEPTPGSRQNIREGTIARFEKGVTTRRDVVLALGEPDWAAADDSSYGYHWSRLRMFWMFVAAGPYGGGGDAGKVAKKEYLKLSFDKDGRLVSSDMASSWKSEEIGEPGVPKWDQNRDAGGLGETAGGRIYSVDLALREKPGAGGLTSRASLSIDVSEAVDSRLEKRWIGECISLGSKLGDIESTRDVADYMREELINEIRSMGHSVAGTGAKLVVEPRLIRFWVSTETSLIYFDAIAEIECDLVFTPPGAEDQIIRQYSGRAVKRTYWLPSSKFFSEVAASGIDDLFAKIRSDPIWTH